MIKLWHVTIAFNNGRHVDGSFLSLDSMNKWMNEMIGGLAKYYSMLPTTDKMILQTTISYEISYETLTLDTG